MREDGSTLLELAVALSDGVGVDWRKAEESCASDEERAVLHHLEVVGRIASFHRSQLEAGSGEDSVSSAETAQVLPRPWPSQVATRSVSRPATGVTGEHPPQWGPLELREKIGEGGFGEVYRAWDPALDRDVALKLLHRRTGQDSEGSNVLAEGRRLARVDHANVATVHGVARHDGRVGLWMEFISGRNLDDIVKKQGRFSADEAKDRGKDLCKALAAIHAEGLVHRDIKAGNVMRAEGGRTVLMDFGLVMDAAGEEPGDQGVSGTPLYMAPEVLQGEKATARSDIYSLGVLLYYLVTGSYPAQARTLLELREAHSKRRMTLLRDARPDLDDEFVKVVQRALEVDPKLRYRTAGEMEEALGGHVGGGDDTVPWLRWAWLSTAAAVVVVATVFGWLIYSPPPPTPPAIASLALDASLYRSGGLVGERLHSGATVGVGDKLYLEVQTREPTYVYIVNQDRTGTGYVLFPLPAAELQNPLRPDTRHRLPGAIGKAEKNWIVDSVGGQESFVVIASRQPLFELERHLKEVPRSSDDLQVHQQAPEAINPLVMNGLRGIGGLAPFVPPAGAGAGTQIEEAIEELSAANIPREDMWMQEILLENPGR